MKEIKKDAVLVIGPEQSGRSTFCKKVAHNQSDITFVNLDMILGKMRASSNPRSLEDYREATDRMFDVLQLCLERENARVIFECSAEHREDRVKIVERLRWFGAERVGLWRFVPPLEKYLAWHTHQSSHPGTVSPEMHYRNFYRQRFSLDEGFNFIKNIDPSLNELPKFVELFWPKETHDPLPTIG